MQKKQDVKTKTEEVKEPVVTAKPEANKAEKAAEDKKNGKKPTGAKRGPKKGSTKAAPKTKEVSTKIELQCEGYPYLVVSDIEERIKNQFIAEGHRAGNIKKLDVYVVPKDNKAYYVINDGKFEGKIDLF